MDNKKTPDPAVSDTRNPAKKTTIKTDIISLIAEVVKRLPAIPKDQYNSAQKFKSRSIDDVYSAVEKIEAEVGIVSYLVEVKDMQMEFGQKGSVYRARHVFRFEGPGKPEEKNYIDVEVPAMAKDWSADKAPYQAISMSHKYAICSTYKIRTGDKDQDQVSPPDEPPQQQQPKQPAGRRQQQPPTGKDRAKVTEPQLKRLFAIMKQTNWTDGDIKSGIKGNWGLDSRKDLTMAQYDSLTSYMLANQKEPDPDPAPEFDPNDIPPEGNDGDFAHGEDPFQP